MKKLFTLLSVLLVSGLSAQTATNFNTNDCAAVNHDLFTELNAGKVIVLTWVMPCGACGNGATYAQNAVNGFSVSNPGQVKHYVADDYGTTNCTTLNNWCASYSFTPNAVFSSSLINMNDYGGAGMPKVVVLGANTHSVFYNANNNSVSQSAITAAINAALSAITSVNENSASDLKMEMGPNPAYNELRLKLPEGTDEMIIYNILGTPVKKLTPSGSGELRVDVSNLSNGSYFIKVIKGERSITHKFVVNH